MFTIALTCDSIAVSSDTSTPNIGGFAWVQVSASMIAMMVIFVLLLLLLLLLLPMTITYQAKFCCCRVMFTSAVT